MRWAALCILIAFPNVGWVYSPTTIHSPTFNEPNKVGEYTHPTPAGLLPLPVLWERAGVRVIGASIGAFSRRAPHLVGWVYSPTILSSEPLGNSNLVGEYTHPTFRSEGHRRILNSCLDAPASAAQPPPQPSPGVRLDDARRRPGEGEKKIDAATQPVTFSAFHGGGGMLGVAPSIGPPPMRVRWTFSTKVEEFAAAPVDSPSPIPTTQPHHSGQAGIDGAPTIDGQTVYIADGEGTLHAIDLATGKQRWTYHADDGFETSPLVMDGRVYIGDLSGIFHAVGAADGKKIWTFDAENTIHSSANAIDGNIVFGTDGADIFCLSPAGKQLWQAKAGDRINGAPAVAGGCVFVSGCDAQLRALKVGTGEEKFAADIGALAPGSPAVLSDRIIIGTDQGRVVAMPRDGGKPIWEFDGVAEHAMVYGSPAADEGIAVVGARDRNVYGLDVATGKLLWTFATRGDVDASPLISSGRVYVASRDRHLYVLDLKTGKELWSFNAARPISASPAIGSGVLVVADTGGTVRCLEPVGK